MTSLTKTTAVNDERVLIRFVGGPYYTDGSSRKLLFPFTFKNGTLEINPINGFNLASGATPLNVGTGDGGLVRLQGGQNLVQQIGQNFKTYITNCTWTDDDVTYTINDPHTISVQTPGVVSRVQQLDYTANLPIKINPQSSAYVISDAAPTPNFTFTSLSNFGVTYAFNTPLVISATAVPTLISPPNTEYPAKRVYITFFSSWEH
jgi:hypothetical protein